MRIFRIIALVLAIALTQPALSPKVNAAEAVGISTQISPTIAQVGEQVEVIVSLTGYTAETVAIRGLQVDVTGIDTDVLSVVEYTSLIEDPSAISNTASYNTNYQRVRLAYVQFSGTLPAPCADVLKVTFRMNPDLTQDGSITLPVTVKMQTVSGQVTLKSDCVIQYTTQAVSVINVDISWGAMEFTYSGGVWNAQTHSYEGAGWSDNGSGFVTVSNSGTQSATASFSYATDRMDISGRFTDETEVLVSAVDLESGRQKTVYLTLHGRPDESLDGAVGTVTVMIGGE